MTLQTYPGALHASDIAERPIVIQGHHLAPDPAAADAARATLTSFLSDNM